jgi:hypothetical protein
MIATIATIATTAIIAKIIIKITIGESRVVFCEGSSISTEVGVGVKHGVVDVGVKGNVVGIGEGVMGLSVGVGVAVSIGVGVGVTVIVVVGFAVTVGAGLMFKDEATLKYCMDESQ